jgi:hypothetical protein
MIVEDDPFKAAAYRKYERHYASSGVEFRTMDSPNAAITTLLDPEERAEFSGVIADFALDAARLDNSHKRIDVADRNGATYTVTTGLGVLDWVHTLDPELPLWALTNDSAAHAPLFMSAACSWLDAKPLSLTRLNSPGTALGDRLLDELRAPHRYATFNPGWKRIDDASAAFTQLLDTPYSGVESFDWLHALTALHVGIGGFIPTLSKKIQHITGNAKLEAYAHTLAPKMAEWQLQLEDIYKGFPDMCEKDRWPAFDLDRLPRSLNAWPDFNPFIEFLGANDECKEFFAAEDVRRALANWRERGRRP